MLCPLILLKSVTSIKYVSLFHRPFPNTDDFRASTEHAGDNYSRSTWFDYAAPSSENGTSSVLSDCFGSLWNSCLGNRKKEVARPDRFNYEDLGIEGRNGSLELSGMDESDAREFPPFNAALAEAGLNPSYADPEGSYEDGDDDGAVRAFRGALEAAEAALKGRGPSKGPVTEPDQKEQPEPSRENRFVQGRRSPSVGEEGQPS